MKPACYDFKGLGFSKIGHFKEVRSKIKELESLNIELARRHNKFEAILNSMTDGLTLLDRNLNITFANKVQKTMFPEISLIGKKCHTAFYRKEEPCSNCPALKTMENRETLRGELLIKEGEFAGRYVEWTTSPIIDPFGHVDEVILLMRDITERKEFEFKLMQADRMAAIGLLAAGIAHEINNPLTSIAGFSEGLLKRLVTNPEFSENQKLVSFREYLEIINNEAYRCKDIIRKLVEFSRKSTDDHEILCVDQIINDTVSLVRKHAKDNDIKIIVRNNLATGFNRISGNESQLKHAFLNLLNYLLGIVKPGGELTVAVRSDGNLIKIDLSDTGDGGSLELKDKIFDPFFAAEPTGKETAINLSICYSIIRRHGGQVEVRNEEGKGSTCTLRFPSIVP
jgi:PAS domain S-box-containing protein